MTVGSRTTHRHGGARRILEVGLALSGRRTLEGTLLRPRVRRDESPDRNNGETVHGIPAPLTLHAPMPISGPAALARRMQRSRSRRPSGA